MSTTQAVERVILSAQVPRQVRDELERRAVAADRSLSAEVRRGLVAYLERTNSEEREDS
jgi:hypothetical protein